MKSIRVELKVCPICGSVPTIEEWEDGIMTVVEMRCSRDNHPPGEGLHVLLRFLEMGDKAFRVEVIKSLTQRWNEGVTSIHNESYPHHRIRS